MNWMEEGAKKRYDLVAKSDLSAAETKIAELEKQLSTQTEVEKPKLMASADTIDGTTVYFEGPEGTAITAGTTLYSEDPDANPEAALVPDATHDFEGFSVVTVDGVVDVLTEVGEDAEEDVDAQIDEPIPGDDAGTGPSIEELIDGLTPVIQSAIAEALAGQEVQMSEQGKTMSEQAETITSLQEKVKELGDMPAAGKTTFAKPMKTGDSMADKMAAYSIPKTITED